jgi:hypothetical protein
VDGYIETGGDSIWYMSRRGPKMDTIVKVQPDRYLQIITHHAWQM